MKFFKILLIGLQGVLSHKSRSFLTALGIIFGIAAVIAMMSIGEGAKAEFLRIISLMGMNNIYIKDNDTVRKKVKDKILSNGLSQADLKKIVEICPNVVRAVPVKEHKILLASDFRQIEQTLTFTSADYFDVLNINIEYGRNFTPLDTNTASKVCIIGNNISKRLFPISNAIGQYIDMRLDFYRVIGQIGRKNVLNSQKVNVEISDYNRMLFLPINLYYNRFTDDKTPEPLSSAIIQVKNKEMIADTVKLIRKILIRRHNKMEDFEIMIPEELLKQHQRTQNIFNMVMLCIASISLLVGGIGIMNIMLASVLERTKEIGLRRAVGATRRDISLQFLLEAVILTFFGGLFGVGAGLVAAELIAMFAGYNTIVTLTSILVSFLVSTATGIIFGYYPARKASNLHPIEALRYE